jgi:hypothetical protein
MTTKEIVRVFLREHPQYDGLVSPGWLCACMTADLYRCPDPDIDCNPGHVVECREDYGTCEHCDGHRNNLHMQYGPRP